jgi:hypothetical protein
VGGAVYYSDVSRYNNTASQQLYDKGLSDAALAHKLPFRVDQESPSDILASVLYGSRTVARCTYDANPCPGKGATGPWAPRPGPCVPDSRWSELAGAALLLAPLGVRPFTDVLWTTATQSDDPRWGVGATRPTVLHDLIVATLSAGPIGFGDLVNHTDVQLLGLALRGDSTSECSNGQLGRLWVTFAATLTETVAANSPQAFIHRAAHRAILPPRPRRWRGDLGGGDWAGRQRAQRRGRPRQLHGSARRRLDDS